MTTILTFSKNRILFSKIRSKIIPNALESLVLSNIRKMSEEKVPSCLIPTQRTAKTPMHRKFVAEANSCKQCDVLFIGDSIVEALPFSRAYSAYAPRGKTVLNFGIGGDRIEHVLDRIVDGDWLDKLKPKLLVLFVGTNNTNCKAEDISEGIENILNIIRTKTPHSSIILPLLHPKGLRPNKYRQLVGDVNKLLITIFEANKYVNIVDTNWSKFIDNEGTIPTTLMYDSLHLTDKGYEIGWKPVLDKIGELLNSQ